MDYGKSLGFFGLVGYNFDISRLILLIIEYILMWILCNLINLCFLY